MKTPVYILRHRSSIREIVEILNSRGYPVDYMADPQFCDRDTPYTLDETVEEWERDWDTFKHSYENPAYVRPDGYVRGNDPRTADNILTFLDSSTPHDEGYIVHETFSLWLEALEKFNSYYYDKDNPRIEISLNDLINTVRHAFAAGTMSEHGAGLTIDKYCKELKKKYLG